MNSRSAWTSEEDPISKANNPGAQQTMIFLCVHSTLVCAVGLDEEFDTAYQCLEGALLKLRLYTVFLMIFMLALYCRF